MPTSLLVTVLVAAVSVWFAPALTRQWDDRQKARELRVAISEDIIAKGTEVIYATTKPPLPGYKPAHDYEAMRVQWLQDSAVIKARLRAYFPQDVVDRWDTFHRNYAEHLLLFAEALPAAQKQHAGQTRLELEEYFADLMDDDDPKRYSDKGQDHLSLLEHAVALSGADSPDDVELDIGTLAAVLEGKPPERMARYKPETYTGIFQRRALVALEAVTRQLLSAHMTGFSTTRRDLLRDLLP